MTAKQLLYREDARGKIRRGVNALADAVKVTLRCETSWASISIPRSRPWCCEWTRVAGFRRSTARNPS